ncbi:MAG TPA: HEPN domain-containing protein [Pyrinomonadaceae bacterium]|nr:HEPN domain-containing protein [Pyrinomonadaceae bacterium]
MTSRAFQTFEHTIQDAEDLLKHFDALNKKPPPPDIEVLKRASLVMALAALETYVEDRIVEAADEVSGRASEANHLVEFYKSSLENDLKFFHTPSSDRVKAIFVKYLSIDVTEGWSWNNYDPTKARTELNKMAKKRGDIAHRSSRPVAGQPTPHAVTRDDLRKSIRFIKDLVRATDAFISEHL